MPSPASVRMTASTSPTSSGSSAEVGSSNSISLRVHGQRAGDGGPLLLAAGQLRGQRPLDRSARPTFSRFCPAILLGLFPVAPQHLALRDGQVVQDVEVLEQVEALEHHAHAGAGRRRCPRPGRSARCRRPRPGRNRLLQQVHAAQQRRLARAGRPDDADDVTARDGQVDAPEHLERAERLVQAGRSQQCSRTSPVKVLLRPPRSAAPGGATDSDSGMVMNR